MTDTAWTPGPWKVKPWSRQEAAVIARVDGKDRHIGGYLLNADAHLSAAAPELYAACAAAEEYLSCMFEAGEQIKEQCSAALAKARGEHP